MKQTIVLLLNILFATGAQAENGYQLWLRYNKIDDNVILQQYRNTISAVNFYGSSSTLTAAENELIKGLQGLLTKISLQMVQLIMVQLSPEPWQILLSDHCWRNKWQQGDVPFLYVQLPNYMDENYSPSESQWALIREGQLKTLFVSNTGMAVAIDLGEWNDIHPDNKKDVGLRLALAAEKIAYGEKGVVYSGPIYQSSKTEGNTIVLTFSNTGSGLISNDDEEPDQFAIAGIDKKFVWAKAKIKEGKVIVWSDAIPMTAYVRYAWADNPEGANLYNKEGLPASPFRTDK